MIIVPHFDDTLKPLFGRAIFQVSLMGGEHPKGLPFGGMESSMVGGVKLMISSIN